MEANIKIFDNALFGQVRSVVDESNEPWFVATDVCSALDISNVTMALSRLDEDERSKFNLGRQGEANIINEFGLYSLVLSSRKPEAKAFKRWITHEVIPSIRKDGGYIASRDGESDEEILARALRIANNKISEQKARIAKDAELIAAQEFIIKEKDKSLACVRQTLDVQTKVFNIAKKDIEEKEVVIKRQEQELKQSAQAVQYHNLVLTSQSTYTATQIAKEFGWGAETLNKKLHAMGIQYKMNGQWLLYSAYCGRGYTKTVTRTFTGSTGLTHTSQSTVWTEIGRKFIHEKLKSNHGK